MTVEVVIGIVGGGVSVASLLFGGGMFRAYIKSREDVAVARHVMKDTQDRLDKVIADVRSLEINSIEDRTKIKQMEDSMKKLDLLPELSERLAALEALIGSLNIMVQKLTPQS